MIEPLNGNIFLEVQENSGEKVSKSGIVIGEAVKEREVKGKVMFAAPNTVPIGSTVLFNKYGLEEVNVNDKKYMVGNISDVIAILK